MICVSLKLDSQASGSHTDVKISELEHMSSLLFFPQKTKKPKAAESVSKSDVSEGKMLKRSPYLLAVYTEVFTSETANNFNKTPYETKKVKK